MERLISKFTVFYYGMKTLILKENSNMELDTYGEKIIISGREIIPLHSRPQERLLWRPRILLQCEN